MFLIFHSLMIFFHLGEINWEIHLTAKLYFALCVLLLIHACQVVNRLHIYSNEYLLKFLIFLACSQYRVHLANTLELFLIFQLSDNSMQDYYMLLLSNPKSSILILLLSSEIRGLLQIFLFIVKSLKAYYKVHIVFQLSYNIHR